MSPFNRGETFPVEILTDNEAQSLIRACSSRAPTGLRNRALIVLLYRGGLRIGETLAIEPKDVDTASGAIRILRGKGGKSRTVGIDAGAMSVVERWIDTRRKRGIRSNTLLCTLKGGQVSPAYVRKLLPRLADRAGIEKRVHPHGLRHTHAAQLASEGVPLNIIARQLGHSNIATTSRYIDHIAPHDVLDAMQSRQWTPN